MSDYTPQTHVERDGMKLPVRLYVVNIEKTYTCDFVVAATNDAEALRFA